MALEDIENKISEVNIRLVKPAEGLVGFASFVYDRAMFIGSIAIFEKLSGGFRLVFPKKKVAEFEMDIAHPISYLVGEAIRLKVVKKLEEVLKK